MAAVEKNRQDWEDLAELDPLWAILSDPERRLNRWSHEEFFASGRAEIEAMLRRASRLGHLERREHALDVGCGVGRLTRALSDDFRNVVGIDISEAMLEEARRLHHDRPDVSFLQAPADDLGMFPDNHFDLVLTKIVLQHLPSRQAILDALSQMVRVLRPGGLMVVQTTSHMRVRHRLQPRARLYRGLRTARLPSRFLYRRLGLQPMRMRAVSQAIAERRIASSGGRVVEADREMRDAGTEWTTYWVTKDGAL